MSRWNIHEIAYYSHDGRVRKLIFDIGRVNIITGASGTGKSAVIQTIDYCFGSTACEIPAFITDRVSAVAIKLINGPAQAVIGRRIRNGASKTSHQMFFDFGGICELPERGDLLRGEGTRESTRASMERLFGISDADLQTNPGSDEERARISLRQATAFMYLTKNVIDSERILFHGLDVAKSASHIIASLPYFLGAIDARTLQARFKMRGLTRGIETEGKRKLKQQQDEDEFASISLSLLEEARACGMPVSANAYESVETRLENLSALAHWFSQTPVESTEYGNASPLSRILNEKQQVANTLFHLRRELRAALATAQLSEEVKTGVHRQRDKLNAIQFFGRDGHINNCPVCLTPTDQPSAKHQAITRAFKALTAESDVVGKYRPMLDAFALKLNKSIDEATKAMRLLDIQAHELVAADNAMKADEENAHRASRTAGRIGFFLEHSTKNAPFDSLRLERYEEELQALEDEFGDDATDERLRAAELLISEDATNIFQLLPVSEPFDETRLVFNAKKPAITVLDTAISRTYKLTDLGSDQNYLSVHIALLFGMHRFFAANSSPVPGVLILDQVSRPYYPDQAENDGREEAEIRSEDSRSLLKYFHFMFDEILRNEGLQVIVLEHAYFTDDERYKNAVRYRWRKDGTERLIPPGWPQR